MMSGSGARRRWSAVWNRVAVKLFGTTKDQGQPQFAESRPHLDHFRRDAPVANCRRATTRFGSCCVDLDKAMECQARIVAANSLARYNPRQLVIALLAGR